MADAKSKFWSWFKQHNEAYLSMDEIDETLKEQLLDELLHQLHLYCDKLYFEVGGMPGEKQELIITAEGNPDFFEKVEVLTDDAPVIDNWIIIAFIPPRNDHEKFNFEDVELKSGEMWFLPLESASNPNSIGIRVCTPNYFVLKESKWFKSAVYKVLDSLLGEKSFALDLNFVDFGELPEKPEKENMIELADLPVYVQWRKAKQTAS